jgi:hypothetical protein
MQKTTEDEENIFLSGFPIKNFGNDKKGVIPERLYCPYSSPRQSSSRGPWYLKVFGFPIKDFGNDG